MDEFSPMVKTEVLKSITQIPAAMNGEKGSFLEEEEMPFVEEEHYNIGFPEEEYRCECNYLEFLAYSARKMVTQ